VGKVKVYTKTGDRGKTSLIGGQRVAKTDLRLEAYGDVDELNSCIGLAIAHLPKESEKILAGWLQSIQHRLFNLGSLLACADDEMLKKLPAVTENDIEELESHIDEMDKELPELHQFILPGGCVPAAHLHLARTVCRRAERLTCRLDEQSPLPHQGLVYLNRLSDFLFVAARFANHLNHHSETVWKK
jgi:cob(I)alamin adenosyltransferase